MGEGKVVAISGLAGHPANEARVAGYREALAKHPEIELVNKINANRDQPQGQQAMQNLLATNPDINAFWCRTAWLLAPGSRLWMRARLATSPQPVESARTSSTCGLPSS